MCVCVCVCLSLSLSLSLCLRICFSVMAGLINDAKEWVADEIADIPKPSADLTDVHIKHATTSAVQLKSDVTVTNPYDHELPLLEITYLLRSNDK